MRQYETAFGENTRLKMIILHVFLGCTYRTLSIVDDLKALV